MKHLSSRPTEDDFDEDPFVLDDLVPDELELITALLCHVRLGGSSKYSHAAMNLLDKIENYVCDVNYSNLACQNVNVQSREFDSHGVQISLPPGGYFELEV
jgi:hypothetical protein